MRWSDQDVNGHVNNARVATLLEEARLRWRAHVIAVDGQAGFDSPVLVAALQLNYRKPIEFGPLVDIDVWVTRIGSRSYTLAYWGQQDGTTVLEASTVMVPVDALGASRHLVDDERSYLNRWFRPDSSLTTKD